MTHATTVEALPIEQVAEHTQPYLYWSGMVHFPTRRHPLRVLIFQQDNVYAAISAYCPHEGYCLDQCQIEADGCIYCPMHGQRIVIFGRNADAWPVQRTETGFILMLQKNSARQASRQSGSNDIKDNTEDDPRLLREELNSLRHAHRIQEQQIINITANMEAMLQEVEGQRNALKIAHKQQQALNAFISRITDSMDEVMIIISPKGVIKRLNQKAKQELESEQQTLVGQNIDYLFPPSTQRKLLSQLSAPAVSEHSTLLTFLQQNKSYQGEHSLISQKAQPQHHIYLVRATLLHNPSGKEEGAVILATNIHSLKLREVALKQSEEKFRMTTNAAQEAIILIDESDHVYFWNQAAERIFGYNAQEVCGKELHEIIVPERYRAAFHQGFQRFRQTGEGPAIYRTRELEALRRDGSEFPVELAIAAVNIDSNWHAIGLVRDITERKQVEAELKAAKVQAEAANQAKSDFLANMSHEIRTPMNAILGMTDLALRTDLTEQQRNYLEKVRLSAHNLLGIINDILDLSKIEAQRMELEEIPFEIQTVLENFSNLISLKAEEKKIAFLVNVAPEVPLKLVGDPLRLGQVLTNLGSNAVKFTEKGGVVLTVSLLEKTPDTVCLLFSLRDSGIGLNEQQQARLFQAFMQADSSTTRRYGGTGLGLVICQHLVNLMGGEITVESQQGRGSTFSFSVNFGYTNTETLAEQFAQQNLHNKHVLVVDDNALACETLSIMLSQFGFKVTAVHNGTQALTEIKQQPEQWALALIDWCMPELDGVNVVQQIKEFYRQRALTCPCLLLVTAHGREELLQTARSHVDGILIKPIYSSILFETVLQVLGKQKSNQAFPLKQKSSTESNILKFDNLPILLVEDNAINQEIASELLTNAGCVVTVAENGEQAVQLVQQKAFAMVLMDVQMPVMDGYAATQAIRQLPDQQELPIIAMTANAMQQDRKQALAVGMNDYLSKPISYKVLLQKVQQWAKSVETTTSSPAKTAPTHAQYTLPSSLPGLDIESGLKQLCGNQQVYFKCLSHFAHSYQNIVPQVRYLLAQKEYEEAEQLLHTFKGVTGNLGADNLFKTSEALRVQLKQTPPQIEDEVLKTFEQQVTDMLSAITQLQTMLPQEMDIHALELNKTIVVQLKVKLKQLEKHLQAGEYINEQQLQSAVALGKRTKLAEHFQQLETAINSYEHEQALQVIARLDALLA